MFTRPFIVGGRAAPPFPVVISCENAAFAQEVYHALQPFVLRYSADNLCKIWDVLQMAPEIVATTAILDESLRFYWVVTLGKRIAIYLNKCVFIFYNTYCLTTFRFDAQESLNDAAISVRECFIHDNFLSAFKCALSNGQGLDGRGVPYVAVGTEVPIDHGLTTSSSTQQTPQMLRSAGSNTPTLSSDKNESSVLHVVPPSPTKQPSLSNPFHPAFRPQAPSRKQPFSPSRTSRLASSPIAFSFYPSISRAATGSGPVISVPSTENAAISGTILLAFCPLLLNWL